MAAALLKGEGVDELRSSSLFANARVFDVIGVFMRLFPGVKNKTSEARARKVAKILKIPFRIFNLEKEFKKIVIDCFLKESKGGLTPNPCVICNKEIKFGLFLEKALKLKADYVATGHYARIVEDRSRIFKLCKGKDKEKDQSYFLWRLNQKQLKKVLLPIGDYVKKEVKNLARKFKLSFLVKVPKSQEICFINGKLEVFLKKQLGAKPGKIVDLKGKILGEHQGLWFYTIGQRKGIGFSGGPYYVLEKDLKNNLLIVDKNEKNLYKEELIVKKANWVSGKKPKFPLKLTVKIRYRHLAVQAVIVNELKPGTLRLKFKRPQRAVTPGQSAVFYQGQDLLGGGIIY